MDQASPPPTGPTAPFNNTLAVQREFFELAIKHDPNDEGLRFALAQTLKELGLEFEANGWYDQGIVHADWLWFPKLFTFTAVSGVGAALLWEVGVERLWALALVVAVGPAFWWLIRRNRRYWLPQVAYMQRSATIERVDLLKEIAHLKAMLQRLQPEA